MSASEVLYGTPWWELELLTTGLAAEFPADPVDDGDPPPGRRYSLSTEEE